MNWKEYARKPFQALGIDAPRESAHIFWRQYVLGKPYLWTNFPLVVNIDSCNYCGQHYAHVGPCEYCYSQHAIACGDMEYQEMPMYQIEWILKNINKYGAEMRECARKKNGYGYWDPFLYGDALAEKRLPEILRLGKKLAPGIDTEIYTVGTLTEKASVLCTENIDLLHFTVSAPNREIYKLVHRGDQFENVLKTMRYVAENRKPNQRLFVHFVITATNFPYMREWYDFMGKNFPDYRRAFCPTIISPDNKYAWKATRNLSFHQQQKTLLEIDPSTRMMSANYPLPCGCWANASIAADGSLLQCCSFYNPRTWNYGNVDDYINQGLDLRDYWMMRLANKMRNPVCGDCNVKVWDCWERVGKIKVNTKIDILPHKQPWCKT